MPELADAILEFWMSLLEAADDVEKDVLIDVAIGAGYLWRCPCDYVNGNERTTCEGYGRRRER